MPVRLLAFLLCCVALGASCGGKRPPTVFNFEGGVQPIFILSEGRAPPSFEVYHVKTREDGGWCYCLLWSINNYRQQGGPVKAIKYGVIPEGYKQSYPHGDAPPPPLIDGAGYETKVLTEDYNEESDSFRIEGGEARPSLMR